jgi:endonuclease YncB( thermonuclease family)
MPFEYHARVKQVVDGDTIVVDIDLGFDVVLSNQKVRFNGIDTPESRTADKVEKIFGTFSKDYVKHFIEKCNNYVIVRTYLSDSTEKFGRILGDILDPTNTTKSLNEIMVEEGLAVKYLGENKALVAEAQLKNRKRLIDSGAVKLTYKEAGVA